MTTNDAKKNALKISKDFPIKQGSLDYLCGVYAAINAMVLRDEITELDQAAIPFRLGLMFMQSKHDWDLAQAVCHGINEDDFLVLLKQMSWRDWDHFPDPTQRTIEKELESLKEGETATIIISLILPDAQKFSEEKERDVVHYTVVTGCTDNGFSICDSQNCVEIKENNGILLYQGKEVELGYIYSMKMPEITKT